MEIVPAFSSCFELGGTR